jgi:hypothetical protein
LAFAGAWFGCSVRWHAPEVRSRIFLTAITHKISLFDYGHGDRFAVRAYPKTGVGSGEPTYTAGLGIGSKSK